MTILCELVHSLSLFGSCSVPWLVVTAGVWCVCVWCVVCVCVWGVCVCGVGVCAGAGWEVGLLLAWGWPCCAREAELAPWV